MSDIEILNRIVLNKVKDKIDNDYMLKNSFIGKLSDITFDSIEHKGLEIKPVKKPTIINLKKHLIAFDEVSINRYQAVINDRAEIGYLEETTDEEAKRIINEMISKCCYIDNVDYSDSFLEYVLYIFGFEKVKTLPTVGRHILAYWSENFKPILLMFFPSSYFIEGILKTDYLGKSFEEFFNQDIYETLELFRDNHLISKEFKYIKALTIESIIYAPFYIKIINKILGGK